QPAEPGPEGPDPRSDRAEVLRRLDAQGRRPRLARRLLRPPSAASRLLEVASGKHANMCSHDTPDAISPRAPRRVAPARAGSSRPPGGPDRGERRAARA